MKRITSNSLQTIPKKSANSKGNKGINIPRGLESPSYTLKADLELDSYSLTELPNPEYTPPLLKLIGIKLTWLTAEEIENMATVVISNSKQSGVGSIYDPSFGTIANHEKCRVCSQDWRGCSGHTGVLKLPYSIPHPMCLKRIADILTCFCDSCHRLVLTWKQMRTLGLLLYHKENRFKAFLDVAKKTVQCEHCKGAHAKYTVIEDKFFACYKKKADVKFPLTYEEVIRILLNIRDQEIKLLGFKDPLCHPKHMIMSNLCVLPSCARPYVKGKAGIMNDDLSHKTIDIQRVVAKLEDPAIKEKTKLDLIDDLFFHVKTMLDNSQSRAKDVHGRRALRAIKQRISGKMGLVHNNIQAKRTHSCARSVVSPNPDLDVREVDVPDVIVDKLTFPEYVSEFNLKHCQKLLDEGNVVRIQSGQATTDAKYACWTRGFKLLHGDIVFRQNRRIVPDILVNGEDFQLQDGDSVLRIEKAEQPDGTYVIKKKLFKNVPIPKRKEYKLQVGQIIERKCRNGDWTITNRQPSLHEASLRAKKTRKHPHKTIRVSLACTQGFGMDFDGDEANIFNACSQNSRADMMELMSTQAQFINGADSKPTLIIKQDNMVGGYLYTLGRVPVSKATFMDVCCILAGDETDPKSNRGTLTLKQITDKMDHIRKVHKWTGMHKEEMNRLEREFTESLNRVRNAKIDHAYNQNQTMKYSKTNKKFMDNRNSQGVKGVRSTLCNEASDNLLYCGHSLFSMLLPKNFEFVYDTKISPDKNPLVVKRGVILSGTFNSEGLQHMIHILHKDYGPDYGCDFITYWQRFTNLLLFREGFSAGLGDCTPKDTQLIDEELEKAFLRAQTVAKGPLDPVQKEVKILSILNSATNIGERIVRKGMTLDNNFMHMITSGAKGKMFNYIHSVSAIGQQNISGKRVPMDCGGRSLPCYPVSEDQIDMDNCKLTNFERHCREYQSRGFVASCFYDGLESRELFHVAMGGREGLIDTSVRTAKCGYLSKKLLKTMEDLKVGYNGMITNAKGTIVQFAYGNDNYSAPELIRTKNYGLQPIDVEHLVDRLNADVEWGRGVPP